MKKKRIVVDLSPEEHQSIKEEALKRNITITKFILQAILYYTKQFNR